MEKGLDRSRQCQEEPQAACEQHGWFIHTELAFDEEKGMYSCPNCGGQVRWKFALPLWKNYTVFSCPVQQIDPEAMFIMRIVFWSEEIGILPFAGGLLDQPNIYFEARNIVMSEKAIVMDEMRENAEKKSKASHQQHDIANQRRPRQRG